MPRIFLHIGPHKTGTSALQHYLSFNRQRLASKKWLYPSSGVPASAYGHHEFARSFLGRSNFAVGTILDEIEASVAENIIISSEEFCLCRDPEPVASLFTDYDVKVIIYIRRQDDLLLSMYNQRVKATSYTGSLTEYANLLKKQGRLDLYGICKRWASSFGESHIMACPYGPSIVPDFLSRVGFQHTNILVQPPMLHSNRSVDARLVGAIRMIGRLKEDGRINADTFIALLQFIRTFEKDLDDNFKCSLMGFHRRQKFLAQYHDSNEKLSRDYLVKLDLNNHAQSLENEIYISDDYIHPQLFMEIVAKLTGNQVKFFSNRG